jgi:hypothetical protein
VRKYGAVTYEAFVEFLVSSSLVLAGGLWIDCAFCLTAQVTITEDSSSPEQLIEAFRLLANGDDIVTQQDLRKARLSPTATSFLSSAMPSLESNGKEERGTEDLAYDCKPYLHHLHSELKLRSCLFRSCFPGVYFRQVLIGGPQAFHRTRTVL